MNYIFSSTLSKFWFYDFMQDMQRDIIQNVNSMYLRLRSRYSVLRLYLNLDTIRALLTVGNSENSGCSLRELTQRYRCQMILWLITAISALRYARIDHLYLDSLLLLCAIFSRDSDGQCNNLLLLIITALGYGKAIRVDRS